MVIKEHKEVLNTKELLAAQFNAFLDKACLSLDGDNFTYAYQWAEWDMETKERRVSAPTASRTSLYIGVSGVWP